MSEVLDILETGEEKPVYRCENDKDAEWCIRQILDAQKEKTFWKNYYAEQLQKVNDNCDATINNMTNYLQDYFLTVPHKETRTQESYSLPSGKLVLKKQDPEFERDEEKIILWLKANGGERFIKTKETLDWSGLKKTLTVMGETVADEDGQIIPDIKAVFRPDVFKVE